MNNDQIEGAARNLTGKAQEGLGNIIGDSQHQAEGVARQLAGRAQQVYGEARDYGREAVHQARDYGQAAAQQVGRAVEQQPLMALLAVGALGFLLGLMTPRR